MATTVMENFLTIRLHYLKVNSKFLLRKVNGECLQHKKIDKRSGLTIDYSRIKIELLLCTVNGEWLQHKKN